MYEFVDYLDVKRFYDILYRRIVQLERQNLRDECEQRRMDHDLEGQVDEVEYNSGRDVVCTAVKGYDTG